jgi:hypothetical protein
VDDDGDRWLSEQPNVEVFLPDRPEGDWRAEAGYGWTARAWFASSLDAHVAMTVMRAEGWEPKRWMRKVRVPVRDGYEAQRLAEIVLENVPDVRRIQLRCD